MFQVITKKEIKGPKIIFRKGSISNQQKNEFFSQKSSQQVDYLKKYYKINDNLIKN